MGMTKIEASGLARVAFQGDAAKGFVAMVLTDTKQRHFAALVSPESLNILLQPLLGLAARWADRPDLEIETLTGPTQALPGTKIAFERGRSDKECAVRIFVGKVELTFLFPVDDVISSTATLLGDVEGDPNARRH